MSLPVVDYLSTDGMTEGVGASQVLAYVERLAERGVHVRLHSFEKQPPTPELRQRLERHGVDWRPMPFGAFGARGGVGRIARGAGAVYGAALVHARADLSAASALLGRPARWLWDCRGLFADQRLALGSLTEGSPEHRTLRQVERLSARRSRAIVTLTAAVIPELERRHGPGVAEKATVITTCVDTRRFVPAPGSRPGPLRLLLAGTLNAYYDVPAMLQLVSALRSRIAAELHVVAPGASPWDHLLDAADPVRGRAAPAEMPAVIAASHAGLSVCRDDAGVSLLGSMPTKIGEFLACGRPVVVNERLGDAADLVREHRVGVVLAPGRTDESAEELMDLIADPATEERCRGLALAHFDLDQGVDRLVEVYRRMAEA